MDYEKVSKRIEKDKAMFVGNEIEGKTLGVVGLGAIGGKVVNAALALGMKVRERKGGAPSLEPPLAERSTPTLPQPLTRPTPPHFLSGGWF